MFSLWKPSVAILAQGPRIPLGAATIISYKESGLRNQRQVLDSVPACAPFARAAGSNLFCSLRVGRAIQ